MAAALALGLFASLITFTPSRAGPGLALDPPQASASQNATPKVAGLRFDTNVVGTKLPDDLKALLSSVVQLGTDKIPAPTTLGQLRRRANEDADRLIGVLRSEAYYNGSVEPVIAEAKGGIFDVTYRVTLGPRTMIRSFRIVYPDHPSDAASLIHDGAQIGLQPNRSVRAQRVLDMTRDALVWLQNHGHPAPKIAERTVTVDLAANVADVVLSINAGAPKRFGALKVENAKGRTKSSYVQSLAKFKEGEPYDRRKADETVKALRQSGLFDQISLETQDDADGLANQVLKLSERPHRSVGIGARWSSDEGAGVTGSWQHRNLFGAGEKLDLNLVLAQISQSAKAAFVKPHFLRDDQSLLANFEVAHDNTDAYDENRIKTGVALTRQLTPTIAATGGVSFEVDRTNDSTGSHAYRLFGVPLTGRYDGANNLLDPTEGARLGLSVTPYAGTSDGAATAFTKAEATGSTYWNFGARSDGSPDFTLALRGRYGTMFAKDTVGVPGSIRFYAGGGGSIRGYGYQKVGPLDASNTPLGGRSVIEASSEVRYRLSDTIGLVAFLDGGNAYSTLTPKLNQPLQWGTGLGLRYYTAIGPVRFDVGVPLNRRRGIDDAFQLYFSLGQAF
ncbi:MAG: BamA/TamA family outer membrane protein [Parvibaculum sp.]|uniref:autotransporter assembly complex protein TamA n=1 Tax=Parvibaculum sp. TaxID=2024848 RepID=UPI00284BAA2A|nr:BamA/TamA family outer membrane protein [Parvibaculum sp.]MDR3498820.1 BamA/TamA family outer membrane protein [Parvibaculum sp.]